MARPARTSGYDEMVRDYGIYGNLGWGRHWLDF